MRTRSDSDSDDDRYTAHQRDRYDVTSGESSDGSTGTFDSDEESSSFESSYGTFSYESSSRSGPESVRDYDMDDVDISIVATEVDGLSAETERPGLIGGFFDSACGWMDRPMSCIGLFPGGSQEISLLRESKLSNTTTVRQLKLNETISRVQVKKRKPTSPEERRSIRLERKGLMDAEEFSTVFRPQEEGSVRTIPLERRTYKTEETSETPPVETLPEEGSSEESPSEEAPEPDWAPREEIATKDRHGEVHTGDKTETPESGEARDDEKPGSGNIEDATQNEMVIGPEAADSEDREAPGKSARQKELKAVKKKRIAAWKSRVREQKNEGPNNSAPPRPEAYLNSEREGAENNGHPGGAPIKRELTTISTIPAIPSGEDRAVRRGNEGSTHGSSKGRAVANFNDLQLPESEDIQSVSARNHEGMLDPNETATEQRHNESNGSRNAKPDPDDNSITDLTHINDDEAENLGDISLPKLNDPPQSISMKAPRVHRRKLRKAKTEVEVIDVFELDDEDSWTPGETRDPSPSQATHRSRRSETSRDPTPSKHGANHRVRRDPSAPKRRPSSPLETFGSERGVEDYAASIWEEEEKKLSDKPVELDFSTAWNTEVSHADEFLQQRKGRLERKEKPKEHRSRSKSRESRSGQPQPEEPPRSNHSRGSRRSATGRTNNEYQNTSDPITKQSVSSQHSRYESPNKGRYDTRPAVMELPERGQTQEEPRDNASVPSKIRDFVKIRSIDDAQTQRDPGRRPLKDHVGLRIHRPSSREFKNDDVGYVGGARTEKTPEPIDVHKYMADSIRNGERTFAGNRDAAESGLRQARSRDVTPGSTKDSNLHDRSFRPRENPGLYSGLVVTTTKSRDTHHTSKSRDTHHTSRSRDARHSSRTKSGGKDTSPETPVEMLDDVHIIRKSRSRESVRRQSDGRDDYDTRHSRKSTRSRRSEKGERRSRGKDDSLSTSTELRKLEKRIEKQLLQAKKGQKGEGWDEQSQVSAKDLRRLEKQLAHRLRKEDEKRAAKLKRLRKRHDSAHRFKDQEVKTISEKVRPETPVKSVHQKAADLRDKSKYDQLRVLRASRPAMRRYMSGSRGSSPAPHQVEILG